MPRHELATKTIVYEIAGAETVTIRRDLPYGAGSGEQRTFDVYYPPAAASGAKLPAVIFAIGYSDAGARARLGCAFKEMESFAAWARLVALSGAAAITYSTSDDPAGDLRDVIRHVQQESASLGVDTDRIGVWACSGHGPTAMSMLVRDAPMRAACAVLYYAYTLDLDEGSGVADAARSFNFRTPCAGRRADDLAIDVPTFVARAGLDQMPLLNTTLDRFIGEALARNVPLTVVNHATGSHAFDLMDDSAASRSVIRQTLAFITERLGL